jgi:hypothetical protein
MEAVVCLEVLLMGGLLLRMDLVELVKRVVRKQGVERQREQDSGAKAGNVSDLLFLVSEYAI